MTRRERILAVYRGETPDTVPFMLDLSHWFYHKNRLAWDLSVAYEKPEYALLDYHRRAGVGFYLPNLGSFFSTSYRDGVSTETVKGIQETGQTAITWRCTTPLGSVERQRVWEENTYAWAVSRWGVKTEKDLAVLGYALSRREYQPLWDRYRAWVDYLKENGVVYLPAGYSAMGQLLNYWMGVEAAIYAACDWPEAMADFLGRVNENNLKLIDLVADSPAEVVMLGDNFSGDIQPPSFFNTWSRDYYREAIRRLHAAGKFVAVHIDGRLRGALQMIRDVGADCADAVTPKPMGDLSAAECRAEAGRDFILSGGVSPELWLAGTPLPVFEQAVKDWLVLKQDSPRLLAAAGDQVPPGAEERRITLMRDLVEEYGRY